jgi:hypothetical protein
MDFEENERDVLPLVAIVVLVLLAVVAGLWWLVSGVEKPSHPDVTSLADAPATADTPEPLTLDGGAEDDSEEVLANLDVEVKSSNPGEVASTIAGLLAEGDFQSANRALGGTLGGNLQGLSPEILQSLREKNGRKDLAIAQVREVGELETNRRKRFALEWEDGGPSPLFLDVVTAFHR